MVIATCWQEKTLHLRVGRGRSFRRDGGIETGKTQNVIPLMNATTAAVVVERRGQCFLT